jgi:hypothetical protein
MLYPPREKRRILWLPQPDQFPQVKTPRSSIPGTIRWNWKTTTSVFEALEHLPENIGNKPFEVIAVELKK